jgi:hypothetical protein
MKTARETGIEIRVGRSWQSLEAGDSAPRIRESDTLAMRGLVPLERAALGPVPVDADERGRVDVRLIGHERLRGHVGLLEVRRASGASVGEIEIVPDKMSESAFQALRADLERVWVQLIFDSGSMTSLRGLLPAPVDLWRAIEDPVRDIAAQPRSVLTAREGVRRIETVRRRCELTPALVRASRRDRPGRSRVLACDMDVPENLLVAETLRRLAFYSRRHAEGADVAKRCSQTLRDHPFVDCGPLRGGVEAARLRVLHDVRYRRVDRVLRILDRPEAHATEGPGEARLGVKAIVRLYEYWVFLQVLAACARRYGPPDEPGFSILGRRSRSGTVRLGIPAGATVSFPGDVYAAFEPPITTSGRGWQGLENVPHPDRSLAQNLITPDVVILRRGVEPALVVVDAKYVGRHWVDYEAAKIHVRYSRIRLDGEPVVRNVLAAHPHRGKDSLWAGYGLVPMIPGEAVDLSGLLP